MMSATFLSCRFDSWSKNGTVFRNWMRSSSGLECFQRPRVSHRTLSARCFRSDIVINPLRQPAVGDLNQETPDRNSTKSRPALSIENHRQHSFFAQLHSVRATALDL